MRERAAAKTVDMADEHGLDAKERAFVVAWLGKANHDAPRAYAMVDPKATWPQACQRGQQMLMQPNVRAYIDYLRLLDAKDIIDQRQCKILLSTIAKDKKKAPKDRIAAIDKMLKTYGAYIERVSVETEVKASFSLSPEQSEALRVWMLVKDDPRVLAVIAEHEG